MNTQTAFPSFGAVLRTPSDLYALESELVTSPIKADGESTMGWDRM